MSHQADIFHFDSIQCSYDVNLKSISTLFRIPRLWSVKWRAQWERHLHRCTSCCRLSLYTTWRGSFSNCTVRSESGRSCCKWWIFHILSRISLLMTSHFTLQVIDVAADSNYGSKVMCSIVENTFTSIPQMASTLISYVKYIPLFCHKNRVGICLDMYFRECMSPLIFRSMKLIFSVSDFFIFAIGHRSLAL